jgi:fibro-slime domain-containing protein
MRRSRKYDWYAGYACFLLGCAQSVAGGSPHAADAGDAHSTGSVFDAGEQPPLAPDTHPPLASPSGSPPMAAAVPADFVSTQTGGYKLGAAIPPGATDVQLNTERSDPTRCSMMTAIVRDFRGARESNPHPDFDVFDGKRPTLGLVGVMLGDDRKPRYASRCEANFDKANCPDGQMTSSEAAFAQWYRTSAGVNLAFLLHLAFEPNDSVYTFESKSFFPLDDEGFGNGGGKKNHNFGFTTELHGAFAYRGGEEFAFTGDDDLWVFINGRLAIDLGGLHPPATSRVDLDAERERLGIEPGHDYTFDLFHAERHFASSNFRVDTTIEFNECGRVTVELL